jgi:hypothetical protein
MSDAVAGFPHGRGIVPIGANFDTSGAPPKTLITPALFSHRPPPNREKRETSKIPTLRGRGGGGPKRKCCRILVDLPRQDPLFSR